MTFILIGMQSSGKSTIIERFLKRCTLTPFLPHSPTALFFHAGINVVKEGTGTRCPLDITCIHDDDAVEPKCELFGKKLSPDSKGTDLTVNEVFSAVTKHNMALGEANTFCSEPIFLVIRSQHVQNMRFVDLPGIISNKLKGSDNRKAIKEILKSEMRKPNTKLCVLLEPKEFATNSIIDFIDETLGGRDSWISDTTFLMTKFDMKLNDSRTGSKSNNFFKEFKENSAIPYLVITPTLETENLEPAELFKARQKLLEEAHGFEMEKFTQWKEGHRKYLQTHPGDEELLPVYKQQIGFAKAVQEMQRIMLDDTI